MNQVWEDDGGASTYSESSLASWSGDSSVLCSVSTGGAGSVSYWAIWAAGEEMDAVPRLESY